MVPKSKSVILPHMVIWKGLQANVQQFHSGAVTIGNFDGLHLGHQSLFNRLREVDAPRVVITFDPHPRQVLHPERPLKRLFPLEDLAEQLPRFAVDLLMILPFSSEFARLPAEVFLERYVYEPFRPRHIVAGHDFAFGSGRTGTLHVLYEWSNQRSITVEVLPPLRLGAELVSSRRVRDLILKGDVHSASLLLGRPFYLRGEVVAGAGRGRRIGCPTMNQKVANETIPHTGVYATRTWLRGKTFSSVTNIGTNPTFEEGLHLKVETHIIDDIGDQGEIRGQVIDVQFLERLREEKKFSGTEELKKQIQSDILKAKGILGTHEKVDSAK